ncbi:MAG: PAS domain-containing protein [bacterium]
MRENEVFWLTDLEKNKMIYVSPAYEKIWGRTCESLYAAPQNWLEAIHPEDRNRVFEAALTKQVAGQYDEIYRIQRPNGSIRWIRDCAVPVRNKTGAIYRIAGIAQDITKRKEVEQELVKPNKNFV